MMTHLGPVTIVVWGPQGGVRGERGLGLGTWDREECQKCGDQIILSNFQRVLTWLKFFQLKVLVEKHLENFGRIKPMLQIIWPCQCQILLTSPGDAPGPGQRRRGEPLWCGDLGDHRSGACDDLCDHGVWPGAGAAQWRNAETKFIKVNILSNPSGKRWEFGKVRIF